MTTFAKSVHSFVPAGLAAYVRVFHPAYRSDGTPVRWAEIAAANGTRAHSGMQFGALTDSDELHVRKRQPGVYYSPPWMGTFPLELAGPLAAALARRTTTPDRCWFAVWHGFGHLPSDVRRAPAFVVPQREYHLLAGPVEAAAENVVQPPSFQSANLWWPDDRAWCVATEIDLVTTYVGCSEACRDAILALPELEALPLDPTTDYGSDLLNRFD